MNCSFKLFLEAVVVIVFDEGVVFCDFDVVVDIIVVVGKMVVDG